MLHIQNLEELDLIYVCAADPFCFEDLEARGRAHAERNECKPHDLARPILFDFRGVALIRQDSGAFSRVIARRQTLAQPHANNPAAFVVRNKDDYGMMRMYCALAAARGLRELDRALITEDMRIAAAWILAWGPQPDLPAEHLIDKLECAPSDTQAVRRA